jgi:polyhydroxybutyrate depolymerase
MTKNYHSILLIAIMLLCHLTTHAQFISFDHEGINRQYLYYEPTNLNEDMPLVFVMHGYTQDANSIRNYSQMNQIADQYGFAVCYPRGTLDSGGNRFWNVGYAFHESETVNDVGFLTALATYLQSTYSLNPDYTFATGFSNGGEMCYMLACQSYDTFKAVAPVAGMIMQDILDDCDNSSPIPLFEIHGSQDTVTPLTGDPNNNDGWGAYPDIPFTINYFAEKNETTYSETETLPNNDSSDGSYIVSEKYLNGTNNNEVWYYEVIGGGHDWPGAWGNMDINTGEDVWLFFQNHINNTLSIPHFTDIEKSLLVFPNPAGNEIKLEENNQLKINGVILYNALGVKTDVKLTNKTINLTHLTTGIYLLKIETSKGIITKKIIKN